MIIAAAVHLCAQVKLTRLEYVTLRDIIFILKRSQVQNTLYMFCTNGLGGQVGTGGQLGPGGLWGRWRIFTCCKSG